jgi:hypothetical protein
MALKRATPFRMFDFGFIFRLLFATCEERNVSGAD